MSNVVQTSIHKYIPTIVCVLTNTRKVHPLLLQISASYGISVTYSYTDLKGDLWFWDSPFPLCPLLLVCVFAFCLSEFTAYWFWTHPACSILLSLSLALICLLPHPPMIDPWSWVRQIRLIQSNFEDGSSLKFNVAWCQMQIGDQSEVHWVLLPSRFLTESSLDRSQPGTWENVAYTVRHKWVSPMSAYNERICPL